MDRPTAVHVFVCLFVEVADRGSLTQTAGPLGGSVAMLCRDLTAIEDWFGARLLYRSTSKISLTDAGMPGCRAGVMAALRQHRCRFKG